MNSLKPGREPTERQRERERERERENSREQTGAGGQGFDGNI